MNHRAPPILSVGLRLILGAALVALFAAPPGASGAAPNSPRSASEPRLRLLNGTQITIKGEHVPGGCRYTGLVVVRPGQAAVEQHEISEDPVACTMVMEQGMPVGGPGGDTEGPGSTRVTGTKKALGARPARTFAAATATQYSAGYSKTWLTDPASIDVNSVKNDVEWYWDGVYLTPGMTDWCRYEYTWTWQSGWGLHENDFRCDFNQPNYPQTWLESSSFVHFKNGVFCGFTDTHVYYDRNRAVGWGDGRLVGQWNVTKSGFCSGALTVHNRTERTVN